MPLKIHFPVLAACALLGAALHAQVPVVLISQGGTQTYCNVLFYDSGGPNGSYGNNENQTITFCPGTPGDSLQIAFSQLAIAPGDLLTLYGGPSTASAVLGTYPGNLTTGYLMTSSDPSGCLTITFTSNGTGTAAGWRAALQCIHACAPPTAAFPAFPTSPYRLCPYDTLALNASASHAAPGRTLASYAWTIAGDTTYTPNPVITLPLSTPGQYPILLQVTDDIGCTSTNNSTALIRVGTRPDFTGSGVSPTSFCAGESVTLHGAAQGRLWSSVPAPIMAGLVLLPDACPTVASYTGTLNVSGFPAGTVISNPNDIVSFCINMEHSYLGDLEVSLACPGGQSVLLFEGYGNGGGGTYLGSPLDGLPDGVPGTGFQYCFSMGATWGTLIAENTNGNWVTAGSPPGNSMAPGTYQPQQPFTQWNGCSLNGPWTLTVTDHLCIDDGFIFGFSMNINSSLYPNVVEFTPVVGQQCDSSYWSGPGVTYTGADCRTATVTPSGPGTYHNTYTVKDDFGCTYDTTFTFTVTPGVTVDPHLPPVITCGQPLVLQPGLQLPIPTGLINYQWSPGAGLSSTTSPFPTANPTVPTWYRLHAFPNGHPLCGNVDSVLVNPLTSLANDSSITDHLCHGDNTGGITVTTTGTGGPWNYLWRDSTGTVVRTTLGANGDTFHGPSGTYHVVISEGANGNGCTDSLIAVLGEPPALLIHGTSTDTTICLTGTATLAAFATGGTGPATMHWDHGLGTGSPKAVSPLATTTYAVHATDAHNCFSDTAAITVTVRKALALLLADTVRICPGLNVLLKADSVGGGDGQYTYNWGAGPSATDTMTVHSQGTQTYCLTLRDGCETPSVTRCTTVEVTPVPPLVLKVDSVLGCKPFLTHLSLRDTTHGALADWDLGDGVGVSLAPMALTHMYTRYGTFNVGVRVHWPNGCTTDSTYAGLITVIDMPHADFSWMPNPASIFAHEVDFHQQAGPTAVRFLWNIDGIDTITVPDPVHNFPDEAGGLYPVQLKAWNFLGCMDSAFKWVNVDDVFLVHIPTAFSPDGDGINDVLQVMGNDISPSGFHFMIFNRWGEKVFDSTDRNLGWDGTYKGKKVPNGVYPWMLRATSVYTGVSQDLRGHVTVVK